MKTIKPYLTAGFMCIALLTVVALRQLVDGPKFRAIVGIGGEAQFGFPVNTITDTEWEQVKHRIEERRDHRYRGNDWLYIPPEMDKDPEYFMPDCLDLLVRKLELELPPFETDIIQFVDTEIQQGASGNSG